MAHLALLTTSFPNGQPGSEAAGSFVADFAEELSRYVHVTVLAPGVRAGAESRQNLTIERFAVPSLPLSLLKPGNPADWINIAKTLRGGQKAMDRISSEKPVDHILALWVLPSGYWARNAWKKHNVRYSVWALGSDIWTLGKIPLVKNFLNAVLRDSYKCFADGYLLKEDVESISGRSCEFLPSARKLHIHSAKALATKPPYRLAFLGRWHPNKGVDLLIEALRLLNDVDWEKIQGVQICGGGPLEVMVKTSCAKLKAAGRPVTTHGYLDKNQAAELFSWADYLVLPSRLESIPVVFSDAMQAGCPLIASPVGDLPRLLTEYSVGTLAAEVSATAIAAAIRTALDKSPSHYHGALSTAKTLFSVKQTSHRLLQALSIDNPTGNAS